MKIRILRNSLIAATLSLALAGCGGGGAGSTQNNVVAPPAVLATVSGVVSKGIIKNGTVKVYAIGNDGSRTFLTSVSTNEKGEYTANLSYTGPVEVQASGSYTDEATGILVTIPADAPLHAAVDTVSGAATVAVTPLTEVAYVKSGATPAKAATAAAIKEANNLVSNLFKVDIIATKPVDAAAALTGATQEQKDYTLALAAISQMASQVATAGGSTPTTSLAAVMSVVTSLKQDLSQHNDAMSAAASNDFKSALTTFLGSSQNKTGESASTVSTALSSVGSKSITVKLALSGSGASSVCGVDATVDLPAGVTMVADALTGEVSSGKIAVLGTASNSLSMGKYLAAGTTSPGTVRVAVVNATTAFGAGDYVSIVCEVAPGITVSAADFAIETGAFMEDKTGSVVSGAAVAVSSATM